jgi:pSer/pThr/pTyr-binding forkhead associated (FHA) protein
MGIETNWVIITIIVAALSGAMILIPLGLTLMYRKYKLTKAYTTPQSARKHQSNTSQTAFFVEEKTGKRIPLIKNETFIGRSDDNDIILESDSYVSRQHAKVTIGNETAIIHNLNSANGIVVNNRLIDSYYSLRNGDNIQIGKSKFKFTFTTNSSI